MEDHPQPEKVKHKILLSIPHCKVNLIDEGEAIELTNGDFKLIQLSNDDILLAIIIKVGDDLQWPLTKDEPVVKIDSFHYLFSLPVVKVKHGIYPLSYGVSFSEKIRNGNFKILDKLLKENSCFSSSSSSRKSNIDWEEFAPKIDAYNNVLAKAIAQGTGQIIKGIFICSNAYTNKVSKMTESMSKRMVNGVGIATRSVMVPMVKSQAGKAFFSMVPGQVLMASFDAINRVLDAAEAAQKQTLSATSGAATSMVSQRFGESAGEATRDVFATAGHCASTAWNVFKIRKAINPSSSFSLKNVAKTRLS